MEVSKAKRLDLFDLPDKIPTLAPEWLRAIAQAAAICLVDQDHQCGVEVKVKGDFAESFTLHWEPVTEQWLRTWNDDEYCTEHGAYCLAFHIALEMTSFTVLSKSRKGEGFDYWLGDGGILFQKKARVEVSGIRDGNRAAISRRVKEKLAQIRPSRAGLPGYAIVVEFGRPEIQFHDKEDE